MLSCAVGPRLGAAPALGRTLAVVPQRLIATSTRGIAQQRRRQVGAAPSVHPPVCEHKGALGAQEVMLEPIRVAAGRSHRWRHRLRAVAVGFPLACPPAFPPKLQAPPAAQQQSGGGMYPPIYQSENVCFGGAGSAGLPVPASPHCLLPSRASLELEAPSSPCSNALFGQDSPMPLQARLRLGAS